LIRSIKDVPVHVFGELSQDDSSACKGWEYYLSDMPNVTIHPAVDYAESLEILKRSKICLNSSPFFKDGSHERMFAGPMCGALVVTNDNLYVRDHFKVDENVVVYMPKQWDKVNEKIRYYLENEPARAAAAASAKKTVLEQHTWDVRAGQLIDSLSKVIGS
jgi:spore maturation protein CgeB